MTLDSRPLDVALTVEQLWQPVPGGSGTYIAGLADTLSERTDVTVTGITARHTRVEDAVADALPIGTLAARLPRSVLYEAWNRLRRPAVPRLPRLMAESRGYDVIHATTWAVPPRSAPLVVTVHDVAFLRTPADFTPRGVAFFRRALDIVRREADIIVVPSEVTRADCVDTGVDPERIRVIPHGARRREITSEKVAEFRRRHQLTNDFILWCGTLEPRKNLGALLSAYESLSRAGSPLDLVLVGPTGWGGATAEAEQFAQQAGVHRVRLLGRVDDDDLHAAYAAARVFCFPSRWEGFGLPVIEAMQHGTPVVTSKGTSMAELGARGAILVDPMDPQAIARAVDTAAGPRHDRLSAEARVNAERYTWAASAELHMAAYREAIVRSRTAVR